MFSLRNVRLPLLILVIGLVPLAAAAVFGSRVILEDVHKSREMQRLEQLTDLAVRLSNVVHEQQKELGAAAVFVGSRGQRFASTLTTQRAQTDAQRAALDDYLMHFDPTGFGAG